METDNRELSQREETVVGKFTGLAKFQLFEIPCLD